MHLHGYNMQPPNAQKRLQHTDVKDFIEAKMRNLAGNFRLENEVKPN